jgi:hypothetical protein
VKIALMRSITVGTAVFLLAACGADEGAGNEAPSTEEGAALAGAPENRDWIPAGIELPQPHTVLQESKIGTRTYLLQVSVPTDPAAEFADWKSALEAAGYRVDESMLADGRLYFDGADVESGQIAVLQPQDVEGYMVQIDVSQYAP